MSHFYQQKQEIRTFCKAFIGLYLGRCCRYTPGLFDVVMTASKFCDFNGPRVSLADQGLPSAWELVGNNSD